MNGARMAWDEMLEKDLQEECKRLDAENKQQLEEFSRKLTIKDFTLEQLVKSLNKAEANLEAAKHDYAELLKEWADYIAENKLLREALEESRDHFNNKDFFTANSVIDKALKGKQ